MQSNRRRFLASTAAAVATLSGVSATAVGQSGEYDVIEARGQTIRIDDGQTWENKLIDLGNKNDITVVATGTNWTIRNIGVTGTWHHTTHEYIFSLADTGGNTSTFENIYAGEGDPNAGSGSRGGVIWVANEHSGRLEVNNVNFNVEGALGIYGSAPGYNGNGGTIHIDGCYANDCHHTAYRIADDGSSITNSVVYKSGDRTAARGIWVWEGYGSGSTIQNVDIITNGHGAGVATKGSPNIDMSDVQTDNGSGTGSNPKDYVPEGCPTSARAAASGQSGTDDPTNPDDPEKEPDRDQKDGYERINIPAGSSHTVNLDEGETFENKLIDITAERAEFSISTQGNNSTIRNIGILGEWDATFFETPILAWTEESDDDVLIENVYFADGATAETENNGPSGVYVPQEHAGTVTIRNLNVQDLPSGGVYASPPGAASGNGGRVHVEDSYASGLDPFGFLVGTDESHVKNSVAVESARGGVAGLNNPSFIDCDFANNEIADVSGGRDTYKGVATLDNCRGSVIGEKVDGEFSGPAERTEPSAVAGVPLSAKQAARGEGADGPDDGDNNNNDNSDDNTDNNNPDDTNPDDGSGGEPDESPNFGFGDGGNGGESPTDREALLDALFGEGGLFDSLFGGGGLFDTLFGK